MSKCLWLGHSHLGRGSCLYDRNHCGEMAGAVLVDTPTCAVWLVSPGGSWGHRCADHQQHNWVNYSSLL